MTPTSVAVSLSDLGGTLRLPDPVQAAHDAVMPSWWHWLVVALVAALVAAGVAIVIGVGSEMHRVRQARRQPPARCPGCGHPLAGYAESDQPRSKS